MVNTEAEKLAKVKSRIWFYEFVLPDGSCTSTDVAADVRPIHLFRRDKLAQIIRERIERPQDLTAVDFASHEGYYSIELSRHFKSVEDLAPTFSDGADTLAVKSGFKCQALTLELSRPPSPWWRAQG